MNDRVDRPLGWASDPATEADVAALRDRVTRLERQLAQMVQTFSTRLTEHGRRLDALDRPPERRPGHEGG
jgi:small-conductance mechanosensitive channel